MGRRSKYANEFFLVALLLVCLGYIVYGAILLFVEIVKWLSRCIAWFWKRRNYSPKRSSEESTRELQPDRANGPIGRPIIRRTVQVGPMHFNLVKSGIEVSVRIWGVSLGLGPKGNYVQMGLGGLNYQRTLASTTTETDTNASVANSATPQSGATGAAIARSVNRSIHTTSTQVLKEIDLKAHRIRLTPIIASIFIVALIALVWIGTPNWVVIASATVFAMGVFATYLFDVLRTTVVLIYDIDEAMLDAYGRLCEALNELSQCDCVWHLSGECLGDGSNSIEAFVLKRKREVASFWNHTPSFVTTNIDVPMVSFSSTCLLFFPDRLFVRNGNSIRSVDYQHIKMTFTDIQCVEYGARPNDAKVVSERWAHAKMDGSPDRRYKFNYPIPTCEYEAISLSNHAGLNDILILSRTGVASLLKDAWRALADEIEVAKLAELERQNQLEDELKAILASREMEHADQAAALANASQEEQPSLPEIENLDTAMLHILCCVMVADGKASKSERVYIHKQMKVLGSDWDTKAIEGEINEFVEHVRVYGGKQVLRRTIMRIPEIQQFGKSQILADSLNGLIAADDSIDERELILCSKLTRLLEK
ncbi:MAG: hypothetical protein JWM11_1984 [Planctomycetaceae bacterium]|nr:hypothetical protein [Planctomycetaceae bacterium]